MSNERLLTTSQIIDILADAATGVARDQFHGGGAHPEDLVAVMSAVMDGAAATLVVLKNREIVRWEQ